MNHRDAQIAEGQRNNRATTIEAAEEASVIGGNLEESLRSPFYMKTILDKLRSY